MPIKVLDERTAARIAAGEVVERPASVVKELVENALDAAATQITVEARGGGVSFIRVIDNGRGIPSDEVEVAFGRHATSKLSRIEDLEKLSTLGFRGEALPSIAAVAEVEMMTSVDPSKGGDALVVRNGKVASHTSQARPRGTTVTVRNLFRSVPARLKFLKSTATENSHVAAIVTQYALAYPEVRFTLLLNERTSLQSNGSGRLIDAIIAVYGVETASRMVEIAPAQQTYGGGAPSVVSVTGMVGAPGLGRAGRDALHFFVNRRAISSRFLTYAVEEAYQGLLMQNRHPAAVVNVSLPPGQVDVNVHPTKSEVKFADERAVFAAVQRAVRGTLVTLAPVPSIEETPRTYTGTPQPGAAPLAQFAPQAFARQANTTPPAPQASLRQTLPALRVIGQVAQNYIVAEGPEGLYVIDQHAAHERVLYEQVIRQRSESRVEVQGLLEPATIEVTPAQDAALKERIGELSKFGFAIEPFGERGYLVRAVPSVLSGIDWPSALREMLDGPTEAQTGLMDSLSKTIACHAAVRAGKVLTDDEMRALLRQLEQTENPYTCPHGRPTLIQLSVRQLEREFGRG